MKLFHHLQSISALEDYEYKRKDVFDFAPDFKFFGSTAYLYPGAFSNQQKDGVSTFRTFIDSAFNEIRKKEVQNLIIDLQRSAANTSPSLYEIHLGL